MHIIIGLGNPGREYQRTRHNVGFDVLDVLSEKTGIALTKSAMHGLIGEGFVGGEKVALVKPQTYMNLSGQCVTELVSWYKAPMENTLVIYDDIDLPLGKLRLRVGVGRKPEGWELADWVLSHYQTEEERKTQFDAFLLAADTVIDWVNNGWESAMRTANAPKKG